MSQIYLIMGRLQSLKSIHCGSYSPIITYGLCYIVCITFFSCNSFDETLKLTVSQWEFHITLSVS